MSEIKLWRNFHFLRTQCRITMRSILLIWRQI